jgi:hypothetical protein
VCIVYKTQDCSAASARKYCMTTGRKDERLRVVLRRTPRARTSTNAIVYTSNVSILVAIEDVPSSF